MMYIHTYINLSRRLFCYIGFNIRVHWNEEIRFSVLIDRHRLLFRWKSHFFFMDNRLNDYRLLFEINLHDITKY